jgi:hypothetical protein
MHMMCQPDNYMIVTHKTHPQQNSTTSLLDPLQFIKCQFIVVLQITLVIITKAVDHVEHSCAHTRDTFIGLDALLA